MTNTGSEEQIQISRQAWTQHRQHSEPDRWLWDQRDQQEQHHRHYDDYIRYDRLDHYPSGRYDHHYQRAAWDQEEHSRRMQQWQHQQWQQQWQQPPGALYPPGRW